MLKFVAQVIRKSYEFIFVIFKKKSCRFFFVKNEKLFKKGKLHNFFLVKNGKLRVLSDRSLNLNVASVHCLVALPSQSKSKMRRADGQRVWVLECVLVNVFGSLFAKKKGFWESFVQKIRSSPQCFGILLCKKIWSSPK